MTPSSLRDRAFVCAMLLLCVACVRRPASRTLSIAAAADLQFALEEVSHEFQTAHPGLVPQIVYGSSGNFYAQIQNHAPFDIFLSADLEYPRHLADEGLALPDSIFTYAIGRLAVWVRADSPLDLDRLQMQVFDDPSVKHIAIANALHAPYGRAAEAVLRQAGTYDRIVGKLVTAENIAQTLQFVQSGSADVGLVALSLAVAPSVRGQGRYWEVPLHSYPRLWQGGIILNRAAESESAAEFREFLTGEQGRRILSQYGFSLPADDDQ
jgi:molybdate transport system substrate-binding protein